MSRPGSLLVLLGVAVAVTAAAGNLDFEGLCTILGPTVPVPGVDSHNLCVTSSFINSTGSCGTLEITQRGLMKLSDEYKGRVCTAHKQSRTVDTSVTGTPLPHPVSDQRPLKSTLPSALLKAEGASYYWFWRNLLNFVVWSGCAATNTPQTVTLGIPKTGNASREWFVPRGWTVHSTIWQPEGSQASGLYWPFATIIYKGDSVAIFIRGTETSKEWLLDLEYSTASWATTANSNSSAVPGQIHRGFALLAASLLPHIKAALTSLVKDSSNGANIKNVYVSGHSLGAGVAALVSYAAQDHLNNLKLDRRLKVDALLFAPPNVGDGTFVAAFTKMVNARRIPFVYDVIPQVPCTPTMVGCSDTLVNTSTARNNGLWQYAALPGTLLLHHTAMPQQAEAWARLDKIHACEARRFFHASHYCSYTCYFSQFVKESNNLCQLWTVPAGTKQVGSYCYDFPVQGKDQYPPAE